MTGTSDRTALEAAIRQFPAEETPRAMLADWLMEHRPASYDADKARLFCSCVALVAGFETGRPSGHRTERFVSSLRLYRVILLTLLVPRLVHFAKASGSIPCPRNAEGGCDLCRKGETTRIEYVGAMLARDRDRATWAPVLGVLSNGGWARFAGEHTPMELDLRGPDDWYVGRSVSIERTRRGAATPMRLRLESSDSRPFVEDVLAAAKGGAS